MTIVYDSHGSLVVYSGDDSSPRDVDWNPYIAFLDRVAKDHGQLRILGLVGRGAPTPVQRKALMARVSRVKHRIAIISPSLIAQTITTVFSWLGANIRMFSPNARKGALAFLAVSDEEAAWLKDTERKWRERLELEYAS